MAMEMVLLPLVGLHVLIGVIKVFPAEGFRLLEAVGGHGEVEAQNQQKQGYADAGHYPAEIKPKAFMLFLLHGKTIIFAKIVEKWQSRLAIRKNSGIFAVG